MGSLTNAEKLVAEDAPEQTSVVSRRELPTSKPVAKRASVPVMTGTHFHSLDDKNRIIIPAKLRPALTETFWMMSDENDNIVLYDYQTGMDVLEYCEQMMAEHSDDEDVADAISRITEAAEEMNVESSFRVQVPDILRYRAMLDKDVVTVGVLNHAVLWSRERWEEAQARREQRPEVRKAQAAMLRAAASGGRRKPTERVAELKIEEEDDAVIATGTAGIEAAGAGRNKAKSTPTGDGGRSSRVLTLSQVGR